ncbi:MAG: feruloyl-CoA synthase [Pseudomonadota bacterium]
MTQHLNLPPHHVLRDDRADGSILLRSGYEAHPPVRSAGDWLAHWAAAAPDRTFLAERSGAGWRTETYAAVWEKARAVGGWLLGQGMGADTPILILSGNGIDHALLALGAQLVGVPYVPVAEQYALVEAAEPRLRYVAGLINPALVFATDGVAYGRAFALCGCPAVASDPAQSGATPFADVLRHSDDGVDAAFAAITPDTVAKILLTSGSTSDPKGVLTTQRMMTTNQAQIATGLPFLAEKPPVLVDWLPWNHVFGGSHNFNMVLAHGGSLYIDDGKPMPALFPRTVENLGLVSGTISFNVPVGFAQLVTALRSDDALRQTYFSQLDMIFYAGASLPEEVWAALEDLAVQAGVQMPLITSSWGLTETAPGCLLQHEPAKGAGIIGAPLPGWEVKLIPDEDGRMDVRVKGDALFQGYWQNPEKTAEAFDDEGFFITGDAMRFVDPDDVSRGMKFDGRISEDFKLLTGTWVQAANLRLEVLAALAPLAADVVLTGAGRDAVGALIVPNRAALEAQGYAVTEIDGALMADDLFDDIRQRLSAHGQGRGSASRIAHALIMAEPPSMAEGEATAKGNINFPKLLARREGLVQQLYDDTAPASITV